MAGVALGIPRFEPALAGVAELLPARADNMQERGKTMMKRKQKSSQVCGPNLNEGSRHYSNWLVEQYEITGAALKHRGLKGTVLDEALGQFLALHFPCKLTLGPYGLEAVLMIPTFRNNIRVD